MQITIGYASHPDTRYPIPVRQEKPWDVVASDDHLNPHFLNQHHPVCPGPGMVWSSSGRRAFVGVALQSRAPARRIQQLHRAGLAVAKLPHGKKTALLAGELLPEGPWSIQNLQARFGTVSDLWAQQPRVNPYLLVLFCLLPREAEVIPLPPPAHGGHRLVDELVARRWLELVPGMSAELLESRLDTTSAAALEAVLLHDDAVAELYVGVDALRGLLAAW